MHGTPEPLYLRAWQAKLRCAAVLLLYNAAGYMALNHFPFPKYHDVPRVPVLDELPLLPWTILPYLSVYVLVGLAVLLQPDEEGVRRYLKASLAAFSVTYVLFALFPTRMERIPLPEEGSAWLWAFRLTRAVDEPHTCLPSLHITNCVLPVLAVLGTRLWPWFSLWAVAIAASTLTTSQHLFLDIPAGAATGLAGWALAGRRRGRAAAERG
ncbi:MAG: phosphatase PAP2 family protein [Planctomycetes bacterium]|nr:phosphatase PAP2 family protein [Planctomycetota bacterium]